MEIAVTIEVLSPIHLGSGQADVNVDAEIIHDALGFPYFPAKRFKGLLYESAVEIFEMFELAGMSTRKLAAPEKIFHRASDGAVQLIVPNFYIKPREEYRKFCYDAAALDSDSRKVLMLLAKFAEYAGVGRLCGQGFGQTRVKFL